MRLRLSEFRKIVRDELISLVLNEGLFDDEDLEDEDAENEDDARLLPAPRPRPRPRLRASSP